MDNNLANNSSLNPNAAPYQPFIPQSHPTINNCHSYHYPIHQINQTQNQQRIIFPRNNYNYNVQNQQNERQYKAYVPKLQLQMRAAVARLDSNNSISNLIIDNPKENTIFYNKLNITVPQKENSDTKILKSQTYQPSKYANDNDIDLVSLLIIGYCHNIEGIKMHMIPNDLFLLFIKFYGSHKDIKLIGFCGGNAGFGVCNYRTENTVYYIPHTSKLMNAIICSATNIKLPFHIINEYNTKYATNQQNEFEINEFNRFNVLFFLYSTEFSAIAFNDNCAFELIFPQIPQSAMYYYIHHKTKPSVYSSKYGLLVSINGALISFSLKTWKWTVIEENEKFSENVNGMCLLKKENKLFIYLWNSRRRRPYYFYDLNTSTFENVPYLPSLCTKPAFCCDETVNRRIYALSRNGPSAGNISYFDLNKFEWIHNALPKHKGMNQIWISNDKNILYGACHSIKRCIFMLDLRGAKGWGQVFSYRPFKKTHCNRFFKL